MTNASNPELALADRLDAEGDHDGAVNALARAARDGHVEATTRLGKRLLIGRDAPFLPDQGARLLGDAVKAGGAEAAARLAVLAAAGTYIEQSLPGAMQLTLMAAQRGWASSQAQLLALAAGDGIPEDAAECEHVSAAGWARIASRIDLAPWRQAPPAVMLSEAPRICTFDGLLPPAVCAWLIDQSRDKLSRALVYDVTRGEDYASDVRTNSWAQFDLIGSEFLHLLMQTRMAACTGLPVNQMEANAILHYAEGEEIRSHFDFVDPAVPNYDAEIARNGQRILTFLIYLNENYDGGETEFVDLDISHKGRTGQGIYFVNALPDLAPDLRTSHAGRPPRQGEKWIVSQFIRSRRVLG